MKSKERDKYIEKLKLQRKEHFEDKKEMQNLRRNDFRYEEVMEVHKKAKVMLRKETGMDS